MQSNYSSSSPTDAAIAFICDLAEKGFWGTLTIKMQHGEVIHVVVEESIPGDKNTTPIPNYRSESHVNGKH